MTDPFFIACTVLDNAQPIPEAEGMLVDVAQGQLRMEITDGSTVIVDAGEFFRGLMFVMMGTKVQDAA